MIAKLIDAIVDPEKAIAHAVAVLKNGELAALPTETVYGLAADATCRKAVERIFATKGRPRNNPLICHVSGLAMAQKYGLFSPLANKLADRFWPGPLTLVVPMRPESGIDNKVTAGLDTIALRCPSGIVGEIAARLERPLAAPSANISGRISPTTAEHVIDDLDGKIDLVIDGGPCRVGVESTIVRIIGDTGTLLRSGGVTASELEKHIGARLKKTDTSAAIEAPGMMVSHYAPRATVRLNAKVAEENEALLCFGPNYPEDCLNLSPAGDLGEAAANLYRYLKRLDAKGVETIAVTPIPEEELGVAINDRLRRAAAPRGET